MFAGKNLTHHEFDLVDIDILKPFPRNSRKHSELQIQQVINSINEFGFTNPILIDEKNTIIAGHARLMAAKKLNMKVVPCVILAGLTESQKKAYVIADNKLALNAEWDIDILLSEVKALQDENFDVELTGFTLDEIADITPDCVTVGLTDDDAVPDVPVEPITKLGDIWTLGNHRLMCGDSTMIDDVEKLMNGENPIAMITDPPYGVNHDPSWRDDYCIGKRGFSDKHANSKGLVKNDDKADWQDAYSLFKGDIVYIWHSAKFTHVVANNIINCGFDLICQIIWAKQHFSFGRGDYHWQHEPCWYAVKKGSKHNWTGDRKQTTLWEIKSLNPIGQTKIEDKDKQEKTGHSTQKPIDCMLRPIENNTNQGDGIYDPFGGSGTTIIACEKTNRKCFMMEISPQYCDVIIKRWEQFTGNKAVLNDH